MNDNIKRVIATAMLAILASVTALIEQWLESNGPFWMHDQVQGMSTGQLGIGSELAFWIIIAFFGFTTYLIWRKT